MFYNFKVFASVFLSVALIFPVLAKQLPEIKLPKFMQISEVIGGINLGGLDVKTYVFKSTKGNKEILAFYNELWDEQVSTLETNGWYFNSYFDGKYLYSIQVQRKSENQKLFSSASSYNGIIGISQPGAIKSKQNRVKLETTFPVTSSTKILTDISSVDLGNKSRTVVLDSPGSVMRNLLHYKRHFEQNGWSEVLNKLSQGMARELGGTSLIMQKGTDELVINFIPSEDNRTKIVSVLIYK